MANEVKIKISADSTGAKPVLEGVEEGLEDVETAADKAGNQLKDVDKELKAMDRQVLASRLELKRLAREFANVEDEAQKIDIRKAMDRVRKDIAESTRVRGALKFEVEPEVDRNRFIQGMTRIGEAAGRHVGPVLGSALGISMLPALAPIIAGAVVGGVGLGGIVGGAVLASRDARVQSAAKAIGKDLLKELEGSIDQFIPAALKGMNTIRDSIKTINFEGIFDNAAEMVGPLSEGIGELVEQLGNGIENVMEMAGPTIEAMAKGLGELGGALNEGMSSLADNSEQAADGMESLFDIINLTVGATFGLVNGLMEAEEFLNSIGYSSSFGLDLITTALDGTTGELGHYVAGASEAEQATLEFQKAAKALSDELKAEADPVFALVKAQDDLEKSQKKVTEATKKFGENSPEAKQALRDLAKNALETQAAAGKLGETFDGKLTPELRATMIAAGLTTPQINRLEKQFREAKREGDRFSGKYQAELALKGDKNIARRVNSITDDLRDFQGTWTATMITNYKMFGKPGSGGGKASGGIVGAAANGATSSGLTLVGEHGPELAEISPGGRVWSNPDTQRMLNGQGSKGGDGGMITVNLVVDGRVLASAMMDPQRDLIRGEFGGDVQAALGRN